MEEIAAEVGISKEDIVYALDAMQNPMSLYEPVYTDGGETLYVMDQISDKKNKEEMLSLIHISGMFSVPALRLLSCAPPCTKERIFTPLRMYKKPIPLGPFNL